MTAGDVRACALEYKVRTTAIKSYGSKLPKRLVFQRKPLVGDFRKRSLSHININKLL